MNAVNAKLPDFSKTKFLLIKPEYYACLFRELLIFLRSPEPFGNTEKTFKRKVSDTIGLYVLKLIFLVPVILFLATVYDPENVQSQNMEERFSPLVLFLLGGFILPFVEEIAFRLSLRFRAGNLALSAFALMYYFVTKAVFQTKISLIDDSFISRVAIAFVFGLVIYLWLVNAKVNQRLQNFWLTNFKYIYYLSCIVFAWMHISKYELTLLNVLLLPILTLPQLFSAIIYGYIRVKFGFCYPLMLHVSMNSLVLIFSLFI
jgi:hypothetical protein